MNVTIIDAERAAYTLGQDHGETAAGWLVDGNTDRPEQVLAALVRGIDDGDPEILHLLPHADLSGQWADGLTPDRLAESLGLDPETLDGWDLSAVCDAFEDGYDHGVEAEVRRMYVVYATA